MSDSAPPQSTQPQPVPLPAPSPGTRFWSKKRVITAVVLVVALLLGSCSCLAYFTWRLISAESATMAAMRPFIDDGYPDYRIIDSTRSGYILQHRSYDALRLDVRFISPGGLGVWGEAPKEVLTPEWSTVETFFRHAKGCKPDPRTDMNYDVDGFVAAYTPLRPGPNAVVSAVWLEGTDPAGVETYVVLVARRNRRGNYVEDMWPDHRAYFKRDSRSGTWTGAEFEPVEIRNPNE